MPLIGMPIVISLNADAVVQTAANDLAHYLESMSGTAFTVQTGDGSSGIVLGLPQDFSGIPFPQTFGTGAFDRDDYRMVSTANSLYLLGATPQAVQHATWDLLDHFGYRRFLPPTLWEIVPENQDLSIDIDEFCSPSYHNRSGPRSPGLQPDFLQEWIGDTWTEWQARNREAGSFSLIGSHEYENIIARNQAAFDQHPEYYTSINGVRQPGLQFCIGNPAVQQLVVADAIQRVLSDPDVDSLPMDPSDGGGHCDETCEFCSELGSVTDRVILLCNLVAAALEQEFEKTYYVGVYAYSHHSPPPSIDVHPNVIVSIATAFIEGGYTYETMLAAWAAKANLLGIRDYYAASDWNANMPGNARAQHTEYLKNVILDSHAAGARFMDAENNGAWGPNGLGYYLSSRMLWDVSEGDRIPEIVDDFLAKCFGPAKEPIANFYDEFNNPSFFMGENFIGMLYRHLEDARALTNDPKILQRIDALILFTRFVELKRNLDIADSTEGQSAFDDLVSFTWRTRETMMVDTLGELYWLNNNYSQYWIHGGTILEPAAEYRVNEDTPFLETEILDILNQGIAGNQLIDFTPIDYSDHLEPAVALGLDEVSDFSRAGATVGTLENFTWIDDTSQPVVIQMTTGHVYTQNGPARVTMEQWNGNEYEQIGYAEVPPDQQWHDVTFNVSQTGLHRLTWNENTAGTAIVWPEDLPRTTLSGLDRLSVLTNYVPDSYWFYVPKGTEEVAGYARIIAGNMRDHTGNIVYDFTGGVQDFISVPVPPGSDGQLWQISAITGSLYLMTVPPYAAETLDDLLLPIEVINADKPEEQEPTEGQVMFLFSPLPAAAGHDTSGVELGVLFHSDAAASVIGIAFYKETANIGTHIGHLWSDTGDLLATTTFTDETATGWQQAQFDTPIPVAADTTYVASYHAPNGGYSYTTGFFAEPYENGPLHATGSAFKYGAGGIFPDETWQETNYWVSPIVDYA